MQVDGDPASNVFPTGVVGRATGTGGTSGVSGVNPNDPDGVGVFGGAQEGTGIVGRTDSSADGTAAIRGVASSTTGATHGIRGVSKSTDDGATGLFGRADASGVVAETTGVKGVTKADADNSTATHPAGVKGEATGSGVTYGVHGRATATHARAVFGDATKAGDSSPHPDFVGGVSGVTDRSAADTGLTGAFGVGGAHQASSGAGYGVLGLSSSSDGFGLYSFDSDARTDGTHEVGGGTVHEQRGDPSTSELPTGAVMIYNSDGSGTGTAGDLVYAVNDGGTIKTTILAQKANAT